MDEYQEVRTAAMAEHLEPDAPGLHEIGVHQPCGMAGHLVPQSASLPAIVILSLRRISLSTSSNFEEAESGILRRASSG
jgi:hypothetical protein